MDKLTQIQFDAENEMLELIEDQTSEYQNTDGVDRSMTQSDLQGRVSAIVLGIINSVKKEL
jgi:hypothetical protein